MVNRIKILLFVDGFAELAGLLKLSYNEWLLGFKFDAWEGGHCVPFIARWPDKIPAGTESNQLFAIVDLMATMADLVDRTLRDDEGPDSFSMLPALTRSPEKLIRNPLVISPSNANNLSIRKGKWMYISGQVGGFSAQNLGDHTFGGPPTFPFTGQQNSDIENGKIKDDAPPAQLYNLEADTYQHQNVHDKYPEVVKEMKALLDETIPAN